MFEMLKVSNLQMARLRDARFGDDAWFVDFVRRAIRKQCRDNVRDIDETSLKEMIVNGIARARSHGLVSAKDVSAFVALMFEIGPNFDEQLDIRAALRDGAIPIKDRFNAMLNSVPDAAWTEAEGNRRSLAWFPELDEPVDGE
jgi:hypothetical protein